MKLLTLSPNSIVIPFLFYLPGCVYMIHGLR
jgi:hypothetical protein